MNTGHKQLCGCSVVEPRRKQLEVWMQLKDRELLAALMVSKKLSGRALSKQAGWESHTYLQRLLRGQVTTLKPERAIIIAHYLGVPLELLFVPRVDRNTEQTGGESRSKKPAA